MHKLELSEVCGVSEANEVKAMSEKELLQFKMMHQTLTRIAKDYMTPDQLRRKSQKSFGLDYEEALEYAYENMQQSAKNTLRQVRLPKPKRIESREAAL